MTCSDIAPLLPEFALDMLDPRQANQVAEHLADGCPNCKRELDELAAVLALLAEAYVQSGDSVAPPAELKAKLFRRISAHALVPMNQDDVAESADPVAPHLRGRRAAAPRRPSVWWRALPYVAATVAGFVVGAAVQWSSDVPRERPADREAQHRARMAQIEKSFDTTRVRMAALHPDAVEADKRGAAVWDGATKELHLFALDVSPPPKSKELVIWLLDAEGRHTVAGRLTLDSAGDAAQIVKLPSSPSDVQAVLVTEEPAGAMPDVGQSAKPTGPTLLVARFAH